MLAHPSPASKRLAPGRLQPPAGACEVLLAWPASLTPSEASETFSGVFWTFRGLGNVQRRVLDLPRPRKRSAARFGAFRGLGNVQRRVLILSEASGRLRPPAKFAGYGLLRCSAGVPDAFRGLGAPAAACEVFLVPGQTWPASLTPSEASETFSGVF